MAAKADWLTAAAGLASAVDSFQVFRPTEACHHKGAGRQKEASVAAKAGVTQVGVDDRDAPVVAASCNISSDLCTTDVRDSTYPNNCRWKM